MRRGVVSQHIATGINAQLKLLARTHRGRSGERQRRMLDWWLYLKTELPDDPVRIARQSDWGQGQLAKVSTLTRNENQADHETSTPSPLRQRYRHRLHPLNRHPKRPHLTPTTRRTQTHFLSFNPLTPTTRRTQTHFLSFNPGLPLFGEWKRGGGIAKRSPCGLLHFAPPTGLEPVTLRLTVECSAN